MFRNCIIFFLSLLPFCGYAQQYDSSIFKYPIEMDTVVVRAARNGWDLKGFIRRMQTDTTFYKSFRTMRIVPYTATNDIKVYDNDGNVIASLYSNTKQNISKGCKTMKVINEKTTGDFYKR